MNYQQRLQKVVDYIGQHIDEKLTLEQLSEVACLSKYHFHRVFTAGMGLSLQQYIRWLRLKRAAHQLLAMRDKSIIDIAMDAGFESNEAFTRAFKQACGSTPSEFRSQVNWSAWEKPPYYLPERGNVEMKVTIEEKKARRLAAVEHRGDPEKMGESLDKLVSWAKAQPMDLRPKPGEAFGLGYDDPKAVAPEDFRHDLAIAIPEQLTLGGDIVEKRLPAGRYAVATHKGSRDNIADTVYYLYRNWLPESGEELGDFPCVFSYYNLEHEVAETELVTECWLLLK